MVISILLSKHWKNVLKELHKRIKRGEPMKKEKTVPRKCKNCEFNFGNVCAGHGKRTDNGEDTYGMPMDLAKKCFQMVAKILGYHYMLSPNRRK